MFPLFNTKIWSASTMVRSRWAMTSTVFPFIRWEMAFWISTSFSGSREAVASSSKIIGASFKRARAMEIRWRSPPESVEPFSPKIVLYPSGNRCTNASQQAALAAAKTCSSVASIFPILILFQTVSLNKVTSWNTKDIYPMRYSGSRVFTSTPPMVTVPLFTSQKRAINRDIVLLPLPEGPTKAVIFPSGMVAFTSFNTSSSL